MKARAFLPVLLFGLVTVSCRKPDEVEISETRVLTTLDEEPAVNATSSEQFLPPEVLSQIQASGQSLDGSEAAAGSSAWIYLLPAADWKEADKAPMREVNLTFGDGEQAGEVYLSVSGGGLQPNVDRWYRQFGADTQPIAELGRLEFLGKQGYLVEATGRYEPGMGRPGKDGQALLGAIVEDQGRLVTVKMIGPEADVQARREQFVKFVASLARK
ncbi:hypothetical protein [Roseibacillus persicicus]|uniref:hypothetical protein n=1 Tax=Roseibacillus persicicus TaxID=454148 RepID=UPI00280CEBCA|nr:hypothetical protein [Roseibacillus persicicus]MDQ8189955.1 hypothetical protein [Roseibacillus persicicus]